MRMALGDFRFLVPSFSIETTEEKVAGRVARQEVIGSMPITQLLGPDTDTLSWESTYFPLHLNRQAPVLMAALQEATRRQTPMPMLGVQGLVGLPMGSWIITEISKSSDQFTGTAGAQIVKVSISLERYVRQGSTGRSLLGIFG